MKHLNFAIICDCMILLHARSRTSRKEIDFMYKLEQYVKSECPTKKLLKVSYFSSIQHGILSFVEDQD